MNSKKIVYFWPSCCILHFFFNWVKFQIHLYWYELSKCFCNDHNMFHMRKCDIIIIINKLNWINCFIFYFDTIIQNIAICVSVESHTLTHKEWEKSVVYTMRGKLRIRWSERVGNEAIKRVSEREWDRGKRLNHTEVISHTCRKTMCRLYFDCDFILIAIQIGTHTHTHTKMT